MLELTQRLIEAAEGGAPVVLASVLESGPLGLAPGTRMLIEPDGSRLGSLGNEPLELLVAEYATTAFERHAAETVYLGGGTPSRMDAADLNGILGPVPGRP